MRSRYFDRLTLVALLLGACGGGDTGAEGAGGALGPGLDAALGGHGGHGASGGASAGSGGDGGSAGGAAGHVPDAAAPDASLPPAACNPVGGEWDCLFPFPSDFFRVPDAEMPSGFRIVIPPEAQPVNFDGQHLDLLGLHPADGFSPISQIMARIPYDLAPGQLVTLDGDYTISLRPESRTMLLEAATGAPVLHISEVDLRAPEADRRAVILRPQIRLKDATRYLVALRRLNAADGLPVPVPRSFAALVAGAGPAALQMHFDAEIFPKLAAAGVPRDDLLLAWDFTTRSETQATADMQSVRTQAMAAFAARPPVLKGLRVTENASGPIFRRVDGVMEVPLYMEAPTVGANLHRGSDGLPAANGTADVPFLAIIPRSVAEHPEVPGRFLQFGHGFFGLRTEITDNFVYEFAEQTRMVVAGVDWWGMSGPDSPDVIGRIINEPTESLRFVDRVHQGMANFMALAAASKTTLLDLPEMQIGGQRTYDPAEVYFYGISQGGILGGTYLALSPDVSRGVLSVGGAGFAMLMQRARPFIPFLNVIAAQYTDPLDQAKFQALSQLSLDRIDPMTYAPHLITDLYPGSPPERRVLVQLGVGDAQVPNLGHHTMARSIGLPLLLPTPRQIPGLRTVEAPTSGSALVELAFGYPEPVPGTLPIFPAEGNGAHEGVRRSASGIRQIDAFFHPNGQILHTCDGVCDPE